MEAGASRNAKIKTKGAIMGLDRYRDNLKKVLTGSDAVSFESDESWKDSQPTLDNWWTALKKMENKDTFDTAFDQSRMTVRAMDNKKKGVGSFNVKQQGQEPNLETDRTMKLAYGIEGMVARTNPENFVLKRKNELGLHDNSVSLLTPDRAMNKGQIKYYVDATYVFMPLPHEADLQLFAILNGIAKKSGSKVFKDYARLFASKLTRVKSAYEYDMGTTYCDVAVRGTQSPGKFRYGLSGTVSTPNPLNKLKPTVTVADALEIARRKAMGTKYKSILASGMRNEIVVAYRQHGDGTTRFPLFARRTETKFLVLGANGTPTAETISMDGKMT